MIFILASKQPALRKILSLVLTALVLISGMLMSAPMLRSHAEDAPDPMDAIVDFNPRTTAPKNNSYYTSKNAYYQCGYGMPNCTAYAYGRAYEILQKKPKLCMGNAYEWYCYNKS